MGAELKPPHLQDDLFLLDTLLLKASIFHHCYIGRAKLPHWYSGQVCTTIQKTYMNLSIFLADALTQRRHISLYSLNLVVKGFLLFAITASA